MPVQLIVAAAMASAVLLIAWGLSASGAQDPMRTRLNQLDAMTARDLQELELQAPFFDRTIRPLAAKLSGAVSRLTSSSFTETAGRRLAIAGYPGDIDVADWLGLKAIFAVAIGGGGFLFIGLLGQNVAGGLLMGLAGLGIGYTLPEFWLGGRGKARQHKILLQIPDALDLLTISVRAGLGFDAALGKVVEKMEGPLIDEFRRALAETRVGKARREALRDMVPRTQVQPLTNFISAIIQAEQLGVSISKVLQIQSEQLRIDRRQRAEEMAQKAPIKMLFPLVGCIFPSLFVVILGPAMIMIMKTLG